MTIMRRRPGESLDLTPRERQVLKALIRAHVSTGEPVSSAVVARGSRQAGSPATVRSVMGSLEDKGLLAQPHTSAGRIPTDLAYRYFIDHLLGRPRMAVASAQSIDAALQSARGEIEDLLSEASRQLSRFSAQVGVVVAPEIGRIVIERIEFARLSGRRVLAVLVGRAGVVHHRMLELDEVAPQEELDRVSSYLNDRYRGKSLLQMREDLLRSMSEERARFDDLLRRSIHLGSLATEIDDDDDTELFVEGTANLLDHPEFADVDRMRSLLRALEEKKRLVALLGRVLEGRGVQVLMGSENPGSRLDGVALVASSYGAGSRTMGTIGIVGPTRMPYVRAIALVDFLARRLTSLLTDGAEPEMPRS